MSLKNRNKKKSNIEAIVNNEPLISDIENRTETPRDKRTLESDIENGCEPNQSENLESPRFLIIKTYLDTFKNYSVS